MTTGVAVDLDGGAIMTQGWGNGGILSRLPHLSTVAQSLTKCPAKTSSKQSVITYVGDNIITLHESIV